MFRHALFGIAVIICAACRSASGAEAAPSIDADFTHVVAEDTAYYRTGPQQGRPPDGVFKAGTKVALLKSAGSYALVRSEHGVTAYVAANTLTELAASKPVEITDDVKTVARSSNQFALDLYEHLSSRKGNLFFSPASLETALAMTYAGAAGTTQQQMAAVLHLDPADAALHKAFGALSEILNSTGKGFQLSMANRLWGQQGYQFLPEFLQITSEHYGAKLASVDFTYRTEQARQEINAWVADQTDDKIQDLIPKGVLDNMTRLVLTNAIYFKGKWAEEFTKTATREEPFFTANGEKSTVAMMHQTADFRYAATDTLQILELSYAGNELSMVVLLPKEVDGLSTLEKDLSVEAGNRWLSALRKQEVQVSLPRFKLNSQFALADVLRSLGMTDAFSDSADFSKMSSQEELKISEVVHKAFVDVNEEGTEAAAATGIIMMPLSAKLDEPVVFRADHPFVFLIRDNRTGAILFMGRMVTPD